MVGANPTRSRQVPSTPNAGIRANTSRGLMSSSTSAVSPNWSITRGEKFSITTSASATSRVNKPRPCSEPKSSVTERLLVFIAWNTQPYSHQSSTSVRMPPEYRMPSGRWIDSILTTSAPNAASRCVADGPAQNAVRSTMRTPASGSGGSVGSGAEPESSRRQGDSRSASPTAGVSPTGAGAHADISQGGRGWWKPAGFSTNTWRSRTYSRSRMVEPLPSAAIGSRKSCPNSTISATVRSASQGWISSRIRSRYCHRPIWNRNCSISSNCGHSTIAAKSSHC